MNQVGTTQGATRAQVVEILKVLMEFPTMEVVTLDQMAVQLTYSSNAAIVSLGDPNCIIKFVRTWLLSTNGAFLQQNPQEILMGDSQGHGTLVGGNSIFVGADSTGIATAVTFGVKVLYRLKNVAIQEYVGMVQSQFSS